MFLNHYVSLRVNKFINDQFRLIIYIFPLLDGGGGSQKLGRSLSNPSLASFYKI